MLNNLPRLLLVSDANLSSQGSGINRTLVNLFNNYPPELLLLYVPQETMRTFPPIPSLAKRVVEFPLSYLNIWQNRLGKFINPLIQSINYQLLDWLPLANGKKIEEFNPEIILICPNSLGCLVNSYKLVKNCQSPFLVYAMDDWISLEESYWLSANGKKVITELLNKSAAWLMISEQLQEVFSQHYQLIPNQSLIVHNPVNLDDKEIPNFKISHKDNFKIIYAGSIWAMHYDTLALVAQAIYELRQEGKNIELILHTHEMFWKQYQEQWESWQVTNGKLIPYEQLNSHLQQGDLLLVVSSFLPEYKHLTQSSLQTKLTDYMASGKAILACGPGYSACNSFVKQWDCGLVWETNQVSEVKEYLWKKINNQKLLNNYAHKAFDVVTNHFAKSKVSSNLYQFIQQVSQGNT